MRHTLKIAKIYLLIAVIIYFAPSISFLLDPRQDGGLAFAALMLINPVLVLLLSAIYAYRHGFAPLVAVLLGTLFAPAALAVYNSSALVYCVFYCIFSFIGLAIGWVIRRLATSDQTS